MNRIKFFPFNSDTQLTNIMIYNGGFVSVNHLLTENLYIIVDIKSGACLKYIKITNKKKDMITLKNYLKNLGVKFEIESRKKL